MKKSITQDLDKMRPMEKHYYLTENSKMCSSCKKIKKLKSFYIKENNTILKKCVACRKKEYEAQVRKLVLDILTKSDL